MEERAMNRTIRRLGCGLLSGALTLVLASGAWAGTTMAQIKDRGYIRVAVANEIPYGFVDSSGEAKGIAPDVAKKVLAEMGIKDIQWVVTQFGSLIPGLKAGRFDMVAAGMAIHPARCQQVLFSEPNSSYGDGLLVKKGNPEKIHSFADIKNNSKLKVAVVGGSDAFDVAQAVGIPESRIVNIGSNADSIATIATGRADAYAATGITVERLAQKSDRVQPAEPFVDPVVKGKVVRDWGAFTFPKDSDAFVKEFNAHLAKVHDTAWYRETEKGFGLSSQDVSLAMKKTTAELCSGH